MKSLEMTVPGALVRTRRDPVARPSAASALAKGARRVAPAAREEFLRNWRRSTDGAVR
jgi:hypothetical protein